MDSFRPPRAFATSAAALALLALAGCSSFGKETRPCPRVSMLKDASRITQYRPGPGRDLTDVVAEAGIASLQATCDYDDDDHVLQVVTTINLAASRGPAFRGGSASFPFFVAVVDEQQHILGKRVFDSAIAFPQGQPRAAVFEEMEQDIPLKKDQTGADFEVIVGFQLSEEQLEHNRNLPK
ncbi:MAG TPA: hypothetical protein VE631_04825 [Alphaproteobacteria bacterium]|nr:hypothetical protein [Alphaproteobacteria bacterium]